MKWSLFLLLIFIFSQLIIAQIDKDEFYYLEEVYTISEPEIIMPCLSSDTENIVSVVLKSIESDNFEFYRIISDNELYLNLDADSVMKDHGILLREGGYDLSLIKSLDLIYYLQYLLLRNFASKKIMSILMAN